MKTNPVVSIIIPNYNRATLIVETLNSIIKQSYIYWECLVIDDGSTDSSEEVIQDYSKKDTRIQFYKRPQNRLKGANACRNYGFELSKGSYINWIDSDDVMHPDKLLKQIKPLESSQFYFSVCKSFVFEDSINNCIGLKSNDIFLEDPFNAFISKKMIVPVQAPLFKKPFLLDNGFKFDETLQAGQEWYFLANILFKFPDYAPVNEPLDYIRSHSDNISNQRSNDKYWYYFLARLKLYQDLQDELTIKSIHILNIFFLFIFKKFVREGFFKKAFFVWKICLIKCKPLVFKDHFYLIVGSILYFFVKKGDGYLSKVSLYEKSV